MMEIIAEIGTNWNDKEHLLSTIYEAKLAGATAFKIQLLRADRLYSARRAPSIVKKLKDYEIPYEWLPELRAECDRQDMRFWASTFDYESADRASEYVHALKIASGDLTYSEFVAYNAGLAAKKKLTLGVSYGAATEDEIFTMIDLVFAFEVPKFVLFHCVSAYPAVAIEYNVEFIKSFIYDVDCLGISDHTSTNIVGILGVAMGCQYFEKHFKSDKLTRKTPDSGLHSLSPASFAVYAYDIKSAQLALRNGPRKLSVAEEKERLWARRGSDSLRPVDGVQEAK